MGRSEQVALIDTGAARSLVSKRVWKEYCEQKKIPVCVKADVTLQSVTGIRIPLQGRGEMEIEGSKITVYISSVVDGIILGDDALRQLNAQINVKENFVILKGKKFPHIQKVKGVGEITIPEPVMKFSKLTNKAYTPTKGSEDAAGLDLYSAYDYVVKPADKMLVRTDIQVELPEGCYGRIAPRSGLALKHFIDVGAGVIDRDYRGNIGILLFNFGKTKFVIKKGDRVAQIILEKICNPILQEVDKLGSSKRGKQGFGSTERSEQISGLTKLPTEENYWLNKYPKLFGLQGNPIGCNSAVKMKLQLNDPTPIRQRPYRTPLLKRKEVERQVEELLELGIIRPSTSPWASPVTLVPKKDGSTRMCVDYRKVNAVTADDGYPMPRISDVLDSLSGCSTYSLIDLRSGYHQLPVDEDTIPITAFTTHQGLYEYVRMPFGLKTAPAVFQRCMNEVLRPVLGRFAMVYLDDICVYSRNEEEHREHLECVFKLLEGAGLTAKASKCTFNQPRLEILGYLVDQDGIRPQHTKVEAIHNMAPPTNIKEVRRFLGMVGFHRTMIPQFAQYSTILTDLTKKHARWKWTSQHQEAFDKLRTVLSTDVMQHHPDLNKPYEVYSDASATAVGAVLIQRDEQDRPRPVQYLSRTLNKTQRLWPAMEREAYAIIVALQTFRPYLYGAQFVVYTDHKPLRAMFQGEVKNTKVQRWAMLIAEYGMPIRYIKGEHNLHADFLSRIPSQPSTETSDLWRPMEVSELCVQDSFYYNLLKSDGLNPEQFRTAQQSEFPDMTSDKDLCVYEDFVCTIRPHPNSPDYPKVWVPKVFQTHLWNRYHAELGHAGNRKVLRKLQQYYRWPSMWKTGQINYQKCGLCRVHSERHIHPKPTSMPIAQLPGDLVATDIVGPFTTSPKGNRYLLTVLDHATAWLEAYPLPTKSAESVVSALHREYLPRFGAPRVLLTDQGQEFQAAHFKDYMRSLGVELRRTTSYHPQTNGRIERTHRTIKQILRKLTNTDAARWEEKLGPSLWSYRITPSVNGFTPYFLQYGKEPRIPRQALHPEYTIINDATERYQQLANSFQTAAKQTEEARRHNIERKTRKANAEPLEVGDRVVVRAQERAPLDPRWDHHYLVTMVKGSVIFLTDQRTGARRVVNREKVLLAPVDDWTPVKPRVKRTQRPHVAVQPLPVMMRNAPYVPIKPQRGHIRRGSDTTTSLMTQAKRRRVVEPTQPQPMDVDTDIDTQTRKRPGPVTRSMNTEVKRRILDYS